MSRVGRVGYTVVVEEPVHEGLLAEVRRRRVVMAHLQDVLRADSEAEMVCGVHDLVRFYESYETILERAAELIGADSYWDVITWIQDRLPRLPAPDTVTA